MGYIDIHSHVLPNMDDGSHSLRQSLEMLRIAQEEGISLVIATPHNMPGKGCPASDLIRERVERLEEAAWKEGLFIQICCGMEYYYREEVLELLDAGRGVTLNGTEYVLVEFEPKVERMYFRNALRNILETEHKPVIAHVERYENILEDFSLLEEIKKMGGLIQINAGSVIGRNGRRSKKDIRRLLKARLVDFVATDAHSDGRRAPRMEDCAAVLYRKYGDEYADALLYGNAEYYLTKN